MKIILLSGWSESGKDTVADILVRQHGFKKYAFADPLKDLCASLYGFPRELANTTEGKKTNWQVGYKTKTIRELLLETALQDRARFGDEIYCNEILQRITLENPVYAVISDLRYPTELSAIRAFVEKSGDELELWRITRMGQTESPVKDPSEHYLESETPTVRIENNGASLEILEKVVNSAINRNKHELSASQDETNGCRIL